MTHSIVRHGLAIAGALLSCAVVLPAVAGKPVQLPTIEIVGVDSVCDGFTSSTTSNGGTVLTCIPSGAPPAAGAPTGCAATVNLASSSTLGASGGNANLAVTCSSPGSGLTYNWFRNGAAGASSAASWIDTATSNALLGPNTGSVNKTSSYQVSVCAGSACVTVPSSPLTVTVPGSGGGGGGGGGGGDQPWNGTCSGFGATKVMTLDWQSPTRMYTSNFGGFGSGDAIVVQFKTGNLSSTNNLPRIAAAEYNSPPSSRIAVLSSKPCDFDQQTAPGAMIVGNSVTAVFAIGTGTGFGYYPVLQTNTTYYLNIKNSANSTCSGGSCDMFIDLVKNGGL